jgi:4,5-dihydroxyphthalate decarboxylase
MTKQFPKTGPVTVHTLLADNASTASFKSGAVSSPIVTFDYADIPVANEGFKPFIRDNAFDFGELAIMTFMQARFYGKPLVLLPAVIGARYQHHCIGSLASKGQMAPKDLVGKKIAVRSYTQTTGVWVRGVLQNEYGVDPDKVTWVCFEDAHVAEFADPPNVLRVPKKKLMAILTDGDADAAIMGNDVPDNPDLLTVIPGAKAAGKAWGQRTGIMPMNHLAVVNADLSQQRPDVVREIYRLLKESRDRDTKPVDGVWTRQFGLTALRPSLETAIDYAFQQGLIPRRIASDELFDDTTRALD